MLKHADKSTKAVFLKLFTQEMIINTGRIVEEKKREQKFEEKQERKEGLEEIQKPIEVQKKGFVPRLNIIQHDKSEKIIEPVEEKSEEVGEKEIQKQDKPKKEVFFKSEFEPSPQNLETIQHPVQQFPRQVMHPIQPRVRGFPQKTQTQKIPGQKIPMQPTSSEEKQVDLGKLNIFLADKKVTLIECPGPEKFVAVRRAGQMQLTKVRLSQKEIQETVETFSRKVKIPVIGGVFKASYGNLTISAVISEFVGSKFIIIKTTPYSLIEESRY